MKKSLCELVIAFLCFSIATIAQTNLIATENPGSDFLAVASVQMRSSDYIDDNVEKINSFINVCAAKGVQVVVFPEAALSSYSEKVITNLTKEQIDQAEKKVAETCRKASVYAIVGMSWRSGEKYYNSATVIRSM
jgi:predicted amidohydrolase